MAATIPPPPATWPYKARGTKVVELRVVNGSLPGLGEGWNLSLTEPLTFEIPANDLSFGRGGIRRCGEIVLRPYRRGGLVRHLNERIYASPERFAREFDVHRALWLAGFPTVEPLGYGWRRRLWGAEGVFLTRYAEASPWPANWERSPEVVPQLSVLLRVLSDWGLLAPDLNATNVLLAADGRILALDWDRAGWTTRGNLLRRYRERLERSLRKLKAPEAVLEILAASLAE